MVQPDTISHFKYSRMHGKLLITFFSSKFINILYIKIKNSKKAGPCWAIWQMWLRSEMDGYVPQWDNKLRIDNWTVSENTELNIIRQMHYSATFFKAVVLIIWMLEHRGESIGGILLSKGFSKHKFQNASSYFFTENHPLKSKTKQASFFWEEYWSTEFIDSRWN